jgi:hypothetical protein
MGRFKRLNHLVMQALMLLLATQAHAGPSANHDLAEVNRLQESLSAADLDLVNHADLMTMYKEYSKVHSMADFDRLTISRLRPSDQSDLHKLFKDIQRLPAASLGESGLQFTADNQTVVLERFSRIENRIKINGVTVVLNFQRPLVEQIGLLQRKIELSRRTSSVFDLLLPRAHAFIGPALIALAPLVTLAAQFAVTQYESVQEKDTAQKCVTEYGAAQLGNPSAGDQYLRSNLNCAPYVLKAYTNLKDIAALQKAVDTQTMDSVSQKVKSGTVVN